MQFGICMKLLIELFIRKFHKNGKFTQYGGHYSTKEKFWPLHEAFHEMDRIPTRRVDIQICEKSTLGLQEGVNLRPADPTKLGDI